MDYIEHSAKGSTWTKKNHKYIRKEGNRYIYENEAKQIGNARKRKAAAGKENYKHASWYRPNKSEVQPGELIGVDDKKGNMSDYEYAKTNTSEGSYHQFKSNQDRWYKDHPREAMKKRIRENQEDYNRRSRQRSLEEQDYKSYNLDRRQFGRNASGYKNSLSENTINKFEKRRNKELAERARKEHRRNGRFSTISDSQVNAERNAKNQEYAKSFIPGSRGSQRYIKEGTTYRKSIPTNSLKRKDVEYGKQVTVNGKKGTYTFDSKYGTTKFVPDKNVAQKALKKGRSAVEKIFNKLRKKK